MESELSKKKYLKLTKLRTSKNKEKALAKKNKKTKEQKSNKARIKFLLELADRRPKLIPMQNQDPVMDSPAVLNLTTRG